MFVTNDIAVLSDSAGADRTEVLRVERQRSLQPLETVDDEDGDAGVDDQRDGVALPGLLRLGVDAEQPVGGPLEPAHPVHAALEDRRHVGAEVAPDEGQARRRGR